jgi:hypothetical protein
VEDFFRELANPQSPYKGIPGSFDTPAQFRALLKRDLLLVIDKDFSRETISDSLPENPNVAAVLGPVGQDYRSIMIEKIMMTFSMARESTIV